MDATARRARQLPFFVLAFAAMVLIASMAGVATLTVSTTTTAVGLAGSNWTADNNVTIGSTDFVKASATASASGTTPDGIEATASNPVVTPGISTVDNWVYQFTVTEASATAWVAGTKYKVEVYSDGNLAATLYFQNGTAVDASVEGVTVKVDMGSSSLPDKVSMKVTKLS